MMHPLYIGTSLPHPFLRWRWVCVCGVLLLLCSAMGACGDAVTNSPPVGAAGTACPTAATLHGAGSTFDVPLFTRMFAAYLSAVCGIPVAYQSAGSGAGMNALLDQSVDFGATDVPMTDVALARSQRGPILHIPVTLGTEAVVYHISGVTTQLRLSGPVLAAIFLGQITFWDDAAIAGLNPGVTLPHESVTIVHRTDGSGTTGIFTRYLSEVSSAWKTQVGASVLVNWPVGVGYQGNAGVAAGVQNIEGAIGYVELSYALTFHLSYALLQNAAGLYLAPSIAGAQAAAASMTNIPADLRFYLVNAPGADSYPVVGYSWVIVYEQQTDAQTGRALARLVWWMIHDGQQYAAPLHYAPLPADIVIKSEAQIRRMICGSSTSPCLVPSS